MNKYTEYIKARLDKQTLYEQLAEECCELAKASLKMIRAYGLNNNITPVTQREALSNFVEELKDVLLVATLILDEDSVSCIAGDIRKYHKLERWAKRLGYKEY